MINKETLMSRAHTGHAKLASSPFWLCSLGRSMGCAVSRWRRRGSGPGVGASGCEFPTGPTGLPKLLSLAGLLSGHKESFVGAWVEFFLQHCPVEGWM